MEKNNAPFIMIAQRLAIVKHLIEQEKFMLSALKAIRTERHALQMEQTDLLSGLREVLEQGHWTDSTWMKKEDAPVAPAQLFPAPTENVPSISEAAPMSEFNIEMLDNICSNEVDLNLTVPVHHSVTDAFSEYEELDAEDDFDIEMGLL